MKKRFVRIVFLLLSVMLILPNPVLAIGNYGVDLNSSSYSNRFSWGQCTWYCFGRANEKMGMVLPCRGNAKDWLNEAANAGFATGNEARANSILVSPDGWLDDGTRVGHVMFVENVQNGVAYITEGNYSGIYHEDTIDLSTGKRASNPDGNSINVTGYIYLAPNILFSDNKNVARTKENIVFHYEGLTEATKVEICFEKNGEVYYRGDATASKNYTTYFNNEGVYYVYVRGQYNGSWFDSKKLRVDITNPVFSVSNSNPTQGQTVSFTYDKLTYANKVELCIEKGGTTLAVIDMTKNKTYSYRFNESGNYKAFVRANYSGTIIESDIVNITVKAKPIEVEEIRLNTSSLPLCVGETATLTATVLPSNATDNTVTWSSKDAKIASVNSSGKVTAVGPGTTTITASAGGKSATCTVTVSPKIEYSIGELTLHSTGGTQLTAIPAGQFLVTVPVTKLTADIDALVFLAAYSANGQYRGLMYVKVKNVPVNATVEVTLPVKNSGGDIAQLKAFVVSAIGSLTPLSAARSFPENV